MPLPLIGGIPWLAGILGGLLFSLVTFFAKFLTKRLALVAAAIVILMGIITTLFAAMLALINAIEPAVPPGLATAAGWIIPDQTPLILSTLVSARLLRWVYEWNVKVIQWKLV